MRLLATDSNAAIPPVFDSADAPLSPLACALPEETLTRSVVGAAIA
jgi:hypothetical protein